MLLMLMRVVGVCWGGQGQGVQGRTIVPCSGGLGWRSQGHWLHAESVNYQDDSEISGLSESESVDSDNVQICRFEQ